jgi:hypothetical protein
MKLRYREHPGVVHDGVLGTYEMEVPELPSIEPYLQTGIAVADGERVFPAPTPGGRKPGTSSGRARASTGSS